MTHQSIEGARTEEILPGRSSRARALKWLVLAGLALLVLMTFSSALAAARDRLHEQPVEPSWQLAVGVFLFAAAVPLSGVLWGRIVDQLSGQPTPRIDAAAAHSMGWVLKYVPGQIGSLVYKVLWGRNRGIPSAAIAMSLAYENLFLQIASLLPAAMILPLALSAGALSGNAHWLILLVGGAIGVAFVALGPGLRWLVAAVARRLPMVERIGELRTLSAAQCLVHSLLFVLPRLLNAVGFVLIVSTLAPIVPGDWLALGSIYVLAGAIGILAVFVPSGLGVREAVIVLLAREFIGQPDAIIAAVIARLLSLVADAMLMLLCLGLRAVSRSAAA
jgi:uncharacterized membrane protein YbhN (UPF0104 family)